MILAIDPGTTQSGYVVFDGGLVREAGVISNHAMLGKIEDYKCPIACEMIASYGMAVGKEVFETCLWVGRFMQHADTVCNAFQIVYRKDVKMHLCGTNKAKDTNIRQALIDKLGAPGTKKEPGATYGVKSHAWAALAVAITALEGNQ